MLGTTCTENTRDCSPDVMDAKSIEEGTLLPIGTGIFDSKLNFGEGEAKSPV